MTYTNDVEKQNEELRKLLIECEKKLVKSEQEVLRTKIKLLDYEEGTLRAGYDEKPKFDTNTQTYSMGNASKEGYEELRDLLKNPKQVKKKLVIPCLYYNSKTGDWAMSVSIRNRK